MKYFLIHSLIHPLMRFLKHQPDQQTINSLITNYKHVKLHCTHRAKPACRPVYSGKAKYHQDYVLISLKLIVSLKFIAGQSA